MRDRIWTPYSELCALDEVSKSAQDSYMSKQFATEIDDANSTECISIIHALFALRMISSINEGWS